MTAITNSFKRFFAHDRSVVESGAAMPFPPKHCANRLVDIAMPVLNEAGCLEASITTLNTFLAASFPYPYRITIVDNGSTDQTWAIAQRLAKRHRAVRALQISQKGRGRALKHAWLQSDADVLAYMDIDLSTDLRALEPLVRPLLNGEATVATGSRLLKQSDVQRSFKREIVSRAYNVLVRMSLGFRTSDAQCGFKAITAAAAKELLPTVTDNNWFFDTELLAKAERSGLTIHEVPVAWREDPDSRVNILSTALQDIRGVRRLRRESTQRSRWERWSILGMLAGTAVLYGFSASHNGYANSFYTAAVQAGTESWKAFFFGSLDAANYITVDKPPVALWAMAVSTRIFGFHAWSMLLPQVLAGIGSVYLVYASVRRWFSAGSALLAAGVMALSPVAVLMFGFNNPDALLTLLLTASCYALIRALDSARPITWLAVVAVATGFAFNTKMLQGLIVVPALALTYLIAAQPTLLTRIKHLLVAGAVLAVSALWWPAVVSAIPASNRPFIGSSTNNSAWDLIIGYNGVGRLLGASSGRGGQVGAMPPRTAATQDTQMQSNTQQLPMLTQPPSGLAQDGGMPISGGIGPGGSGFGGAAGTWRMLNSDFGPNIGWLLPGSAIITIFMLWQRRRKPRTDVIRAACLLWGGYTALHVIVFSMVSGIIHPYYPVVMTPAIAALIGMGVPLIVKSFRHRSIGSLALPVTIAVTAITACILLGYQAAWLPWLRWMVLIGGLGTAVALLTHIIEPLQRQVIRAAVALAAICCFAAPSAYALQTANVTHTGSIPSAGPAGTGMQGSNNETAQAEQSFIAYLLAHKGTATWIVAVSSANESAPIQISSGQPVMAIGGFMGSDAAMTTDRLQQLVASGQLRYYAVSSGRGGMGGRGPGGNNSVTAWIESNATVVDYGGSEYTLYDLLQ